MRTLILLISLMTTNLFAGYFDCAEYLVETENSSHHFKLHEDKITKSEYREEDVIFKIFENTPCKNQIGIFYKHCSKVSPKKIFSHVCYFEIQFGYMFLTSDLLGTYNVIFNAWD